MLSSTRIENSGTGFRDVEELRNQQKGNWVSRSVPSFYVFPCIFVISTVWNLILLKKRR